MLWDVFGKHLDRVPSEEVFKLSETEVEAFSCLKHHSFETTLALATKVGMASAEIKQKYSEWTLI